MGLLRLTLLVASLLVAGGGCAEVSRDRAIARWLVESAGEAQPVELPAHLELPAEPITYVLRAEVDVPSDLSSDAIELVIPHFAALASLRVDGLEAVATSTDFVDGYRGVAPKIWRFPDQVRGRARVVLELTVQHRWTQSAWLDTIPRLNRAGTRDSAAFAVQAINGFGAAFAVAGLVLISILYLAVFLVDRGRKAYLWFAIQGVASAMFPLFVGGFSQVIFGVYDGATLAILMSTAIYTSVQFTHAALSLGPPSRLWLGLIGLTIVTAAVGPSPFEVTGLSARVAVCTIVIGSGYQLWVIGRLAFQSRRPGAIYLWLAWAQLAVLAPTDFLSFLGIAEPLGGIKMVCLGLGTFSILQALFLSRVHIQTLHTADSLNVALAARVAQLETRQREVEQLNVELRHQIADRSGHLVAAIRTMIDPAAKTPALAPGQIVQGRYELQREIGSGGMGTVYEVVRLADRRHLALKVAHGFDAVALARLAREAQIASQLAHPNVVAILDVDIADEFLYIVMELLVGRSLHEMRDRFGDPAWALPVLAEIADGLAALHAAGIVHRDLKPANVMIADGANGAHAKIMDFGISRISQEGDAGSSGAMSLDRTAPTLRESPRGPKSSRSSNSTLTHAGSLCGTPQYMAPELVHGDRILPSADLFSLGVLAYELLTKDAPWPEPVSVALAEGRTLGPPTALAIRLPDLDPAIAAIFDRCLLATPRDRPTAGDVRQALSRRS